MDVGSGSATSHPSRRRVSPGTTPRAPSRSTLQRRPGRLRTPDRRRTPRSSPGSGATTTLRYTRRAMWQMVGVSSTPGGAQPDREKETTEVPAPGATCSSYDDRRASACGTCACSSSCAASLRENPWDLRGRGRRRLVDRVRKRNSGNEQSAISNRQLDGTTDTLRGDGRRATGVGNRAISNWHLDGTDGGPPTTEGCRHSTFDTRPSTDPSG